MAKFRGPIREWIEGSGHSWPGYWENYYTIVLTNPCDRQAAGQLGFIDRQKFISALDACQAVLAVNELAIVIERATKSIKNRSSSDVMQFELERDVAQKPSINPRGNSSLDWVRLVDGQELIGRDIETSEGSTCYRGPIMSAVIKGNTVILKTAWTASKPYARDFWTVYHQGGMRLVADKNTPIKQWPDGTYNFSALYLRGWVTLLSEGNNLDHSLVEGLLPSTDSTPD